jgi:hypothetical protein
MCQSTWHTQIGRSILDRHLSLSNTTKLIPAWFTSTRGVYLNHIQKLPISSSQIVGSVIFMGNHHQDHLDLKYSCVDITSLKGWNPVRQLMPSTQLCHLAVSQRSHFLLLQKGSKRQKEELPKRVQYDLDWCLPDANATERQDHTSQDHFFTASDKHPVRNSEPDQTTMLSWATSRKQIVLFRKHTLNRFAYVSKRLTYPNWPTFADSASLFV